MHLKKLSHFGLSHFGHVQKYFFQRRKPENNTEAPKIEKHQNR